MTLGERVQLGEAAFVEAPTKTDARDAQQEAFAAVELVAPALAEAGAQRVGQPHRVVVDLAHDEVEEADRAAVRDEEGELDGGGSWGRAEEGVTHRLQQAVAARCGPARLLALPWFVFGRRTRTLRAFSGFEDGPIHSLFQFRREAAHADSSQDCF